MNSRLLDFIEQLCFNKKAAEVAKSVQIILALIVLVESCHFANVPTCSVGLRKVKRVKRVEHAAYICLAYQMQTRLEIKVHIQDGTNIICVESIAVARCVVFDITKHRI